MLFSPVLLQRVQRADANFLASLNITLWFGDNSNKKEIVKTKTTRGLLLHVGWANSTTYAQLS